MKVCEWFHNSAAAALAAIFLALPAAAVAADTDSLLERLKAADAAEAGRIEEQIRAVWSRSGSPAMDLLLRRGREALEAGDTAAAIEHLTALVDHAPDFAEGWHARATAWYQAGEYGPAVADLARTLELNPRHFAALAGFAAILETTGREAQAIEVYRAALAIHPHMAPVEEAIARLEAKAAGHDL